MLRKSKQYWVWLFVSSSLIAITTLFLFNLQNVRAQSCPYAAVNGLQPYPAALASIFTSACTNSLITDKPTPEVPGLSSVAPKLPRIGRGYPPSLVKYVDGYIPCIILMAIGQAEAQGWKQFVANYGSTGNTNIGNDYVNGVLVYCGYGITQLTYPVGTPTPDPNVNRTKVVAEPTYNIGAGARLLIEKWNEQLVYYSGNNDPYIAEDWYYAVWAYNYWGWTNNPNRNCPNINPSCTTAFNPNRGLYTGNPNEIAQQWPYQEKIWGWAANPPTDPQDSNKKFWQATALTLPPRSDLAAPVNGDPTLTHINTAQPAHGSCTKLFAPMITVPTQVIQAASL